MNNPKNKLTNYNALAAAVKVGLGISSTAVLFSFSPGVSAQGAFGSVVELSMLFGDEGFVVRGIDAGDKSGVAVSGVGDINGDGDADLLIGASGGSPNSNSNAGESYVVFGGKGVGSNGTIQLSNLDGADGFVINGVNFFESSGNSVSGIGDFNDDGVDDFIIGAALADTNVNGNGLTNAGESYVIFGKGNVGGSGEINLSDLDGNDGFVISGIEASGLLGTSVSEAGDVNGDGVDDLIVGAEGAVSNGNNNAGKSFVVFGGSAVGSSGNIDVENLDGNDGYVINGIGVSDNSGASVSKAGDVNGDGVDDLLIGAPDADPNGSLSGESYVVFGGGSVGRSGTVNLITLDGSDGFVISGVSFADYSGISVSDAGDINGDSIDDLIIGADRADVPQGNGSTSQKFNAGESYVLFGSSNIGSSGSVNLSTLDGSNGFVVYGAESGNRSGRSVSSAGDVNADGIDDVIIGATNASSNGFSSGQSYVLFGSGGIGSTGSIELSELDGNDGFTLNGIDSSDQSGWSISSAGDINGDRVDDFLIGSPYADQGSQFNAGETYVVFGQSEATSFCNGLPVTVDFSLGQSTTPGDDVVLGTTGADDIRGKSGNDTICGRGGADFIHGNSGDDWIDGGNGVDNIRGGQGDDILFSGTGATVGTSSRVFGGDGDDIIHGGVDADDLRGGRGDDMIFGEQGADDLKGNDDDDVLYGGSGADTLSGGNGRNDELFGESGADSLNGGGGINDFCDGGGQNGDSDTNCEVF